ncbi:DUF1127 domain-containing protein [Algihabitans albus]|uniref:DUF1127 domain-containing protein n=1 Tax=Algihabitans albus TaxID=2164067 RepID=UPI000E5D7D36|nr:DUF1127 domain-containing protein [Algihabitans albus]
MTISVGTLRRFVSHGHTADHDSLADYAKAPLRQSGAVGPLEALINLFIAWQDRANQRHDLAEMDDRLLRDVGLDRLDVEREIAKPFWRS